eukprot:360380-Chlamydomonas_euryale.AAC.8
MDGWMCGRQLQAAWHCQLQPLCGVSGAKSGIPSSKRNQCQQSHTHVVNTVPHGVSQKGRTEPNCEGRQPLRFHDLGQAVCCVVVAAEMFLGHQAHLRCAMQPCSHAAVCHAAMQPCAMQPCSHVPCSRAAMQPRHVLRHAAGRSSTAED